jgi:citrate lyase subunit beta/citryl-CoA lyase
VTTAPARRWRSALFAPANQPALVPKLPRTDADVIVLDLEDAVPRTHKAEARALVGDALAALAPVMPGALLAVRINAAATEHFTADLAALAPTGVGALVVPKVASVDDIGALHAAIGAAGFVSAPLIVAGIETALGVADARSFLGSGVDACYFGAEDFVADMGGVRTAGNAEVAFARAQVVLAARVAGIPALDIVTADFRDEARFRREAAEARALGYRGKLCIHPGQVAWARQVFTPTPAEIDRARRVLDAWAEATARGVGAIAVDGELVDEPMITRARAVLAAAD